MKLGCLNSFPCFNEVIFKNNDINIKNNLKQSTVNKNYF